MPTLMRKKAPKIPKPNPAGLYRALSSFATAEGAVVRLGTVPSGTNRYVVDHPFYFVLDSTPDDEAARIYHIRKAAQAESPAAPDPRATILAQPIPAPRRVRAVKQYVDRTGVVIRVGDMADANDAFVKANAGLFAPHDTA
jgi:hypothetical protein